MICSMFWCVLALLSFQSHDSFRNRLIRRSEFFRSTDLLQMHSEISLKSSAMQTIDFSLISWNVLAPCYKKLPSGEMESMNESSFIERTQRICELLISENSDIICIQEFWCASETVRGIYCQSLRKAGYSYKEVRRTSHWRTRKDGIATFTKDDRITVQDTRNIFFHDAGDRVAQLLLLAIQESSSNQNPPQQFLVVNTHLLFPHNEFSSKIRMREMTKILGFVESYRQRELCSDICGRSDVKIPVIIAGDMNGKPSGRVYQYIRSQNYKSAMEEVWMSNSAGNDKWSKWISHRNHRVQLEGVDHVFYLNPADQTADLLSPVPDWTNLVFREVLEKIREKQGKGEQLELLEPSADMRRAFEEFDEDKSQFITAAEFEAALLQLGFGAEGEPALTQEEISLLVSTADKNGDGSIDFKEFCDRFTHALSSDESDKSTTTNVPFSRSSWLVDDFGMAASDQAPQLIAKLDGWGQALPIEMSKLAVISKVLPNARPMGDLSVQKAEIWPKELEEGIWPEEFTLSDHGMVKISFKGTVAEL